VPSSPRLRHRTTVAISNRGVSGRVTVPAREGRVSRSVGTASGSSAGARPSQRLGQVDLVRRGHKSCVNNGAAFRPRWSDGSRVSSRLAESEARAPHDQQPVGADRRPARLHDDDLGRLPRGRRARRGARLQPVEDDLDDGVGARRDGFRRLQYGLCTDGGRVDRPPVLLSRLLSRRLLDEDALGDQRRLVVDAPRLLQHGADDCHLLPLRDRVRCGHARGSLGSSSCARSSWPPSSPTRSSTSS
jgi:hypothetical protein